MENNDLIVFTDGSTINNGKKNAKAGFGVYWPYLNHLSGSYTLPNNEVQTNNRAEYRACIQALKQADEIDPNRNKKLIIYSDSMLLINSMTKWIYTWRKNNWKKADKNPVLNQDLLEILSSYIIGSTKIRNINWIHVQSHTGNTDWISVQNDIVDKLAKDGANKSEGYIIEKKENIKNYRNIEDYFIKQI